MVSVNQCKEYLSLAMFNCRRQLVLRLLSITIDCHLHIMLHSLLFSARYGFCDPVQRISNCGDIQHTSLTPHKALNI